MSANYQIGLLVATICSERFPFSFSLLATKEPHTLCHKSCAKLHPTNHRDYPPNRSDVMRWKWLSFPTMSCRFRMEVQPYRYLRKSAAPSYIGAKGVRLPYFGLHVEPLRTYVRPGIICTVSDIACILLGYDYWLDHMGGRKISEAALYLSGPEGRSRTSAHFSPGTLRVFYS